MKLSVITLDCGDPLTPAAFHREATGLELHPKSDAGFAALEGENGVSPAFQRVDDHRPPNWPDRLWRPDRSLRRGSGA